MKISSDKYFIFSSVVMLATLVYVSVKISNESYEDNVTKLNFHSESSALF